MSHSFILLSKIKENYLLFLLLWMAMIFVFSYSWLPGGLDSDSCGYAVVAKEALHSNSWLKLQDPTHGGDFYYHFPLAIWVNKILFRLFGVSTFTAKLFSMASAVALVGVIFYFGRLLVNQWVGFFAGASFLMTNHVVRLARQCRMDLPVSLFITFAILTFILAQRRSRLYYLLCGGFSCLAIMVKDVFGLAPLAIIFIYLVICRRGKEFFHPSFIAGLVIAIVPVLLWVWLDQKTLITPWYRSNFLHLFRAERFHVPWYYYIWALVTKYFYFLPFAVYGGYLAVKEARVNKKDEFLLLIIWAVLFPLAFSFGKQKLHYFILPIYPATSLLAGMAFNKIFPDPLKLKIAQGLKTLLIIGSIIMLSFPLNIRSRRFAEAVALAPAVDKLLQQVPEYEFISYKQDSSALLFSAQELTKLKNIEEEAALEKALSVSDSKSRFLFVSDRDFAELPSGLKQNYRVILKYKDRIIAAENAPGLVATLP